jgi:hypothetical protein
MERAIGAIFWGYMIYHFVHHWGLVVGHFPYHKPETEWSDQELGVPDDSDGLAPVIPEIRSIVVPGASRHHSCYSPHFMKLHYGDIGLFKF